MKFKSLYRPFAAYLAGALIAVVTGTSNTRSVTALSAPAPHHQNPSMDESPINPSQSMFTPLAAPVRASLKHNGSDWKDAYRKIQARLLNNGEYTSMPEPEKVMVPSHAIAGALLKEGHIEAYRIAQRTHRKPGGVDHDRSLSIAEQSAEAATCGKPQVVALVRVGEKVDGHEGIVHGGIVAMLMDDVLGYGFYSIGWPAAFTANLNIDYRAPVPAHSTLRIECYFVRQERRKLFWKVRVVDAHDHDEYGSYDGATLYAEATSLFVIPKQVYDSVNVKEEKDWA